MLKFYELATLHLTFAGMAGAPEAAARFTTDAEAKGRLLGCWRSELGELNKLVLLREFESAAELAAERIRTRTSCNPFYCADTLSAMELDSYVSFPGFEHVVAGEYGGVYEIRTYQIRPGGFATLIPEWLAAVPTRSQFSKLLLVMYALDGENRMIHIWPYANLTERSAVRQSVTAELKTWPVPSGAKWLDPGNMKSGIFLPTAQSALR